MNKVAIIGTGQTHTKKKRKDVILPELMRESIDRALEDADIEFKEIDAVIYGGGPELFEGVNHPEKWCTDIVRGGSKIPVIRVHTGGTVGASAGTCGFYTVASGMFDTVLVVSGNKLTESSAQEALSYVFHYTERGLNAGPPSGVAIQAKRYMHLHPHVTEDHFALLGVKARKNALKNPYATLHLPNVSVEMLKNMPYLASPIRLLDSCPVSDGSCAMVLQTKSLAKKRGNQPMSWIQAVCSIPEGAMYPDRDWGIPLGLQKSAEGLYKKTGITNPFEQIDIVELYDAFTVQELIWTDGLRLSAPGKAVELLEKGITQIDGSLPINPSGGVVSTNTIGASALIRQAEVAAQIMSKAGMHQVEKANIGLSHGWGGILQFHVLMLQSKKEDLVHDKKYTVVENPRQPSGF